MPRSEVATPEVLVPAGQAKGTQRGHHKPRVRPADYAVAQAGSLHISRLSVLDESVGVFNQRFEQAGAGERRHIEGHAELVAVDVQEQATRLGVGGIVWERAVAPRAVATHRRLDLDDLSAKVGHELRGVRGRDKGAVLKDAQSFQWLLRLHASEPR